VFSRFSVIARFVQDVILYCGTDKKRKRNSRRISRYDIEVIAVPYIIYAALVLTGKLVI